MLVVKSFVFNPVEENTYLLYNEQGDCCIIDPGCYFPEERDELKTGIEKTGLNPVLLLNTHAHFDHIFGNRFVFNTWGLIPHLHAWEGPVFDNSEAAAVAWQMPFEGYKGPLEALEDGQRVRVGTDELLVMLTPGHSPGSVSFYCEKQAFVIGGDVLFRDSIGRTDLPGGDHRQLLETIRERFFSLPDDTTVYPGHGPITTIGYEKRNNPFMKVDF